MTPDNTGQKQDNRFKPGKSGNPAGRPKGSRNRLSEMFLSALADDFDQYGVEVIEKVRLDRPYDYLKVVAAVLPRQMEIEDSFVDRPNPTAIPRPETYEDWLKYVEASRRTKNGSDNRDQRMPNGSTDKDC